MYIYIHHYHTIHFITHHMMTNRLLQFIIQHYNHHRSHPITILYIPSEYITHTTITSPVLFSPDNPNDHLASHSIKVYRISSHLISSHNHRWSITFFLLVLSYDLTSETHITPLFTSWSYTWFYYTTASLPYIRLYPTSLYFTWHNNQQRTSFHFT